MPLPVNEIRTVIAVALCGLLLLLRLDAPRFSAAEYDVEDEAEPMGWLTRLAWPVLAIALAVAAGVALPAGPAAVGLGREAGLSVASIVLGVLGAVAGIAALLVVAWIRYPAWPPRISPRNETPRLAFDAVETAIVDELTFRGVLLGLMLLAGVPAPVAFLVQLLLYGLETRLGRDAATLGMLVEALAIGSLTGVLAIASGGVVAPIVAHVAARFAALELPDSLPPLLAHRPF